MRSLRRIMNGGELYEQVMNKLLNFLVEEEADAAGVMAKRRLTGQEALVHLMDGFKNAREEAQRELSPKLHPCVSSVTC